MRVVLGQVIDRDLENSTIDVKDYESSSVYKTVDLDSDINFQQMPAVGAIVMLVVDGEVTSATRKLVKVWSTAGDFRRALEENELQIQATTGAYIYMQKDGSVEIRDGSFHNSIKIIEDEAKIILNAANFELINFTGITIKGEESGRITIQSAPTQLVSSKIIIEPTGKILIQSDLQNVEVKANAIKTESLKNTEVKATGGEYKIDSEIFIKLGFTATQSLVLGELFMTLFNSHSHPSAVGPTGPPLVPMTATQHLSAKTKTE